MDSDNYGSIILRTTPWHEFYLIQKIMTILWRSGTDLSAYKYVYHLRTEWNISCLLQKLLEKLMVQFMVI